MSLERVTLPSIQEMFPDHLLGLPASSKSPMMHSPRIVHSPHSHHSPLMHAEPVSPPAPSKRSPSAPQRERGASDAGRRTSSSDEERRHACPECGKAFNRPSSLAIHVNTHTGAKPFQCLFPGCGRRFNVNSNMRRHFRNHTSPAHRPLNASSPYTYPLTTAPRMPGAFSASPSTPHAYPLTHAYSYAGGSTRHKGSDDTDEEDELSESESAYSYGGGPGRARGYSTSSVPSTSHYPHYAQRAQGGAERRPRAHTYSAARPTVLHPSSEAYRRAPVAL